VNKNIFFYDTTGKNKWGIFKELTMNETMGRVVYLSGWLTAIEISGN